MSKKHNRGDNHKMEHIEMDYSRFAIAEKLAMMLLEKKRLNDYTPEKLAEEFIQNTKIILEKIEHVDFSITE